MPPRTLQRAPGYTLQVRTRVPTGQVAQTKTPSVIPPIDTRASDFFGLLGGLTKLGYSVQDFFNQNNQRNADKNWNEMLPDVQETYTFMKTQDVGKIRGLHDEALKRYQDHIASLDVNDKIKDKMLSSLSSYTSRKMEGNYEEGLATDGAANLTNLNVKNSVLVQEEDLNGILLNIDEASTGEDAWLNMEIAGAMKLQATHDVGFETLKNDLLEISYTEAYADLTDTVTLENGGTGYANYPNLSGADREKLKQIVTQEGTWEAQQQQNALYAAQDGALDSLYSREMNVDEFYKTPNPDLNDAQKAKVIATYEAGQATIAARLSKAAAEPIWRRINDGTLRNPDYIRSLNIPNLSEGERKRMIDYLEGKIPKPKDPSTTQAEESRQNYDRLLRGILRNDYDEFTALRAGLQLLGDINPETGLSVLTGDHYNKLRKNVEDTAALERLTAVVNDAQSDPRLEDPADYDEFIRLYTNMWDQQLAETDADQQMNLEQFREMGDKLITTITDDKLQEDFKKAAASGQNVGFKLGTSWNSNNFEDAVQNLNDGLYDAMKYTDPASWESFTRKMIDQYELLTGKPSSKPIRMYKDKVPVFYDENGNEQMIIMSGNVPQVVPLETGLQIHQNLALGYSVGDRNADGTTMLSTGWYDINDSSVKIQGSFPTGDIFSPTDFPEDFYIVYDDTRGPEIRPYHGAMSNSSVAAAVKNFRTPETVTESENFSSGAVDNAIIDNSPRNFYPPGSQVPVEDSIEIEAKKSIIKDLGSRGFGGYVR